MIARTETIWRSLDIGKLVDSAAWKSTVRKSLVCHLARKPEIAVCRNLTRVNGVTSAHVLALLRSMPRLETLEVTVKGADSIEEDLRRITGIADGVMSPQTLLDAIGGLEGLTDLQIWNGLSLSSAPAKFVFPPRLRRLTVRCFSPSSPCSLFAGYEKSATVRELVFCCNNGLVDAIHSCPEITSLTSVSNLSESDMSSIWQTCDHLEELSLSHFAALALSDLSGSHCAKRLRKLDLDVFERSPMAFDTLCRSCPGVEELSVSRKMPMSSPDIKALALLTRLHSLSISVEQSKDAHGLSEAFSVLGSEGAPFLKLALLDAVVSLSGFFASPRCHLLRELTLSNCQIPEEDVRQLAENVSETLTSLVFVGQDSFFMPLLSRCSNLSRLKLSFASDATLSRIGAESKAPLRIAHFDLWGKSEALLPLVPALRELVELVILCDRMVVTSESIVQLTGSCPNLRRLSVPSMKLMYQQISKLIPPTVNLCT